MRLEFFIGYRYLFSSKRTKNPISLLSLFASISVFLGVLVPLVVMSVFLGFQNQVREKILGSRGHITIKSRDLKPINNYSSVVQTLQGMDNILSTTPYIEAQGMAQINYQLKPVLVRGVKQSIFDNDAEFNNLLVLQAGKKNISKKYRALIGSALASEYYLNVGARFKIITLNNRALKSTSYQELLPKIISVQTIGIFQTGYYEYDSSVVYTSLKTLQDALNLPKSVHAIDIKIKDFWQTDKIAKILNKQFNYQYIFMSWQELNANLFKALATERVIMWIIMTLILTISIFNVTSSQTMLVIEKKKEIGILKTLGSTPFQIAQIFLMQGLIVTIIGATLGAVGGVLLASNLANVLSIIEKVINFFISATHLLVSFIQKDYSASAEYFYFFPQDVYYLNELPAAINAVHVIFLFGAAIFFTIVAGLIPSLKAANMKPIDVIRQD